MFRPTFFAADMTYRDDGTGFDSCHFDDFNEGNALFSPFYVSILSNFLHLSALAILVVMVYTEEFTSAKLTFSLTGNL